MAQIERGGRMTPRERAVFIEAQIRMFGKTGSASGRKKIVEFIAAAIEEAEKEAYRRGIDDAAKKARKA